MTRINPNEFQGYPVDLLRGLKGLGPSIVADDALYQAAQAYNASAVEGGVGALGPALLTADASESVRSITAYEAPLELVLPKPPAVVADAGPVDEEAAWDALDLDALVQLCATHSVVIPGRVKTHGKLKALLIAAGVTP